MRFDLDDQPLRPQQLPMLPHQRMIDGFKNQVRRKSTVTDTPKATTPGKPHPSSKILQEPGDLLVQEHLNQRNNDVWTIEVQIPLLIFNDITSIPPITALKDWRLIPPVTIQIPQDPPTTPCINNKCNHCCCSKEEQTNKLSIFITLIILSTLDMHHKMLLFHCSRMLNLSFWLCNLAPPSSFSHC